MDNQRQRYYFIVMYSTTVTEVTETCFAVATFLCEKSSEEPVRVARVKKKVHRQSDSFLCCRALA